jgi:hypothetical protein
MEIKNILILKGVLLFAGLPLLFLVAAYLFYWLSKTNAAITVGTIFIVGLILRYVLPGLPSMFITRKGVHIVLPLNRLVFWSCLFVGLLGSAVVMAKAMVSDFGIPEIDRMVESERSPE